MPEIEVRLDNLETLQAIDKDDMASILGNFPLQCEKAYEIGLAFKLTGLPQNPSALVIQGMGGSGMSGRLLQSYLGDKISIPIYLNNDYILPEWVNSETLFIAVSYSGNTEETLDCYIQAKKRGCHLLGITSGGKLAEYFSTAGASLIILPAKMPPRTTIGYLFIPMLLTLERLRLIKNQKIVIKETISLLEELHQLYQPASSEVNNLAKKIAYHLHEKIPIFYACQRHLEAVVGRWKSQINENAKQVAFYNVFPEMTHIELVGWGENREMNWQLGVVFLKDKDDHPRNQLLMKLCQQLIGPKAGDMIEVNSQGESLLSRIFSLIYLGDYMSYYAAILNAVNPTPIKVVDFIKNRLQEAEK